MSIDNELPFPVKRQFTETITESKKKMIKLTDEYEHSISALMQFYFDDLMSRNSSRKTLKTYNTHLKDFYNFIKEIHNFDDDCHKYITQEMFKAYSSYLLYSRENFTQQSVISYLRTLRAFFNWCIDNEYVPYFKMKMPKVQESIKQCYTDDELKLLLKKPNIHECDFTEYRVWVFENFLLSTGQRLGSTLNIKINDIDFLNNIVNLTLTKNSKAHTVEISKEMSEMLKEYLKVRGGIGSDYLFCNSVGDKWDERTCQDQVAHYNKIRGVEKTSIHLFRHTFGKNFILNGGDAFVLQKILDHSSLDTSLRYVRLYGKDLQGTSSIYNPIKKFKEEEPKKDKIKMKKGK